MGRLYYMLGVMAAFCLTCYAEPGKTAPAPLPINCQVGEWTAWSDCDPCTHQRYRSRDITKFAQYGGARCQTSLGEHQRCFTDLQCGQSVADCGSDFQCDSGRCIKQRLVCNGDNDCGDNSDETCDDKDPKPVCSNDVPLSEIGRTAGDGFNLLGVEIKRNPFDNEFFNGLCDRVRDGNTRTYYRKPWNVAALVYQTKADKSFTKEVYHDAQTVITKVLSGNTLSLGLSVTAKLTPDKSSLGNGTKISGEAGLTFSRNASVEHLKEYTHSKDKTFLRIVGSVQLATFQMRTRNTVLSSTFIEDLNLLPYKYEQAEYFAFLEMYGTHYASSGTIGGKYELIYVLDSHILKIKDITTDKVVTCLGFNGGISVQAQGIDVAVKADPKYCHTDSADKDERNESIPGIEKVISFVEGGTVNFASAADSKLTKDKDIDSDTFVKWAASLVDAPAIISKKLSPIYTLIPDDLRHAYTKSKHLERAIEDYTDEYNLCKCQPCQNGGTLMLLNGECLCTCQIGYEGLACEQLTDKQFEKPTQVDGGWSCWKSSSTCANDEEKRTRTCDHPAPPPGGRPCIGEATRMVPCYGSA